MAEKQSNPHAILIPLPFQGVINPFVNLALKIASKGIPVTFVHLDFIHHRLSKAHHKNTSGVDFFSEARKSGLDIRLATISDGFPLEYDRDLNPSEYRNSLFHDFPARVDEFVGKTIRSDPNSAHFLVSESLWAWPAIIAEKHKILNVDFSTQAAFVFSLAYNHWDLLREKGHLPCKDTKDHVEINYIPGVESISTKDLMTYLDTDSVVAESFIVAFKNAKKSDFILHNTVEELESGTLSSLNESQPNYAIGPVNFYKIPGTKTVSKSFWPESDCANWLSSKPAGSVIYVSFGSLVELSDQIIEEIACGLILSGVNFIWVARKGIVLPAGFKDEIKDNKGLVVPWCDQIMVLSDPAVGGFVTHCGWNSTLESMWCGVPMICYPVAYDQPTNRKLVVDDWKVGTNLGDQNGTIDSSGVSRKSYKWDTPLIDRMEVAEKMKSCVDGTSAKLGLKPRAEKVKETLKDALGINGSSEKNFDLFVNDLKKKLDTCTS